jgi:16S rRNA (cytosine1402-N4)-methyltransferase
MGQAFDHQPVMVDEVVALFAPVGPGVLIDATVGGGGHAAALLDAYPHLRLVGLDRDPAAVAAARIALFGYGTRAAVLHARFDRMRQVIDPQVAEAGVRGVLFDLGVSSPQLDRSGRGFSYRADGPLDMRMDPEAPGPDAAELVNTLDVGALASMFAANGEGRFARRIATAIVAARPVSSTAELAEVVRQAIPAPARRSGGHPARRVFQALRIAVNDELDVLGRALPDALDLLGAGGRCVAIAYHSGEDRIVKSVFADAVSGSCRCPPGLPCVCGATPTGRLVFRGTRKPSDEELGRNRRAESARMRALERLGPSGDR